MLKWYSLKILTQPSGFEQENSVPYIPKYFETHLYIYNIYIYIYIIQTNCDARRFLSFSWIHESNIFGNTSNLVDCFAAGRFRLKVNWLFQRFPGTVVQVEYSNYAWSRDTSFFFTVAFQSFNGSLPICLMLVCYSCFHQIPFTIRLEHHTIRFLLTTKTDSSFENDNV